MDSRWKKASEESINAVWHDPSTYDPTTMGPPYLPGTPRAASFRTAATLEALPSILASILTNLQALSLIHWTNHWVTRGPSFYGDHLLFERLYNETTPMIDAIAERCVGNGGTSLVHPASQAANVAEVVASLTQESPADYDQADLSLRAVQHFLSFLRSMYTVLEEQGLLTHGTDNLLQDIADKHEGFVYLLQQKLSYMR